MKASVPPLHCLMSLNFLLFTSLSKDLALRSIGSHFFYRQIGCFKQTYVSKACILRLNELRMPEACFFFSGMKWHIVQAYVSAIMTGPPHASSAFCITPHAATTWRANLAFFHKTTFLMEEKYEAKGTTVHSEPAP